MSVQKQNPSVPWSFGSGERLGPVGILAVQGDHGCPVLGGNPRPHAVVDRGLEEGGGEPATDGGYLHQPDLGAGLKQPQCPAVDVELGLLDVADHEDRGSPLDRGRKFDRSVFEVPTRNRGKGVATGVPIGNHSLTAWREEHQGGGQQDGNGKEWQETSSRHVLRLSFRGSRTGVDLMPGTRITRQPLLPFAFTGMFWASLLGGIAGCDGESTVTDAPPSVADDVRFPEGVDPGTLDSAVRELLVERLRAVESRPDDGEAWGDLADAWLAHARYDLAVDPANRAVVLQPDSARRRLLLAVALGGAGESVAAYDMSKIAVGLDPDQAFLAWRAAAWALEAGELEDAWRLAARAIELDPTDAHGHRILGMTLLADRDPEQAVAVMEPHVGRQPGDLAARYLLGRALQVMGRDDDGARELTVAGAARPTFIDPWTQSVRDQRLDRSQRMDDVLSLAAKGRREDAFALLAQMEARYGPEKEIRFGKVAALAVLGDHAGVLSSADEIIAVEPGWAPPRLRAGLAAVALAQRGAENPGELLRRAREEGLRCVELTPGDPQAHELIGRAAAADGRWGDALVAFRRCLEIEPSTVRYHIAVADSLVETGGLLDAIRVVRRVDETFGRSVDSALVESRALAIGGRARDARRLLEQCRGAMPNHPGVRRTELVVVEAGG